MLTRLNLIETLRSSFASKRGDDAIGWHTEGALAIKDFHGDLSAYMDAVAALILESAVGLTDKERRKLPGFADIQEGTQRSFRAKLPSPIVECIDSVERWWPSVKRIRDLLSHREHQKIAFGGPSNGVLFQLYDATGDPLVVDPAFLDEDAHNVVRFSKYSAYLLAEISVFADSLGSVLSSELRLNEATNTRSFLAVDLTEVLGSLDEIADSLSNQTH